MSRARAAARAHAPSPCRLCAQYQQVNKEAGNEWFTIEAANKTGTRWQGKVWTFHDSIKYEFDLEFDIPVSYPSVAPELALPELDGKTEKMYRGGKARAATLLLSERVDPLAQFRHLGREDLDNLILVLLRRRRLLLILLLRPSTFVDGNPDIRVFYDTEHV